MLTSRIRRAAACCRLPQASRPFLRPALADALAGGIFAGAVLPFAGVIARRLGASAELLALLATAQFVGFLLSFVVTRLAARVRWGRLMLLLRMLSWLPLLLILWTGSPTGLVLLLATGHLLGATSHAFFQAIFRDHIRGRFRAGIMTMQRVSSMLVALPLAWLVGLYLDAGTYHYQQVFFLCALAGILLTLPFLDIKPGFSEKHGATRPPRFSEEWRILKHDRPFLLFMLALFVGTLAEKIGMPIIPIYFADDLDLRYGEVGLALGVVGPLLAIGGFLFWGWQSRRYQPLAILVWSMMLKALRPALWALAPRLPNPFLAILIGEGIFRWAVAGLEMGSLLAVLRFSPPSQGPLYIGIHFTLLGLRGLLGPIIGWGLYRLGVPIPVILWLISAIVLTGGLLLWRLQMSGILVSAVMLQNSGIQHAAQRSDS